MIRSAAVYVWFLITNLMMMGARVVPKQVKDGKACDKDVLAWRDVVRGDKAGATSQEQ